MAQNLAELLPRQMRRSSSWISSEQRFDVLLDDLARRSVLDSLRPSATERQTKSRTSCEKPSSVGGVEEQSAIDPEHCCGVVGVRLTEIESGPCSRDARRHGLDPMATGSPRRRSCTATAPEKLGPSRAARRSASLQIGTRARCRRQRGWRDLAHNAHRAPYRRISSHSLPQSRKLRTLATVLTSPWSFRFRTQAVTPNASVVAPVVLYS